MIQIDLIERNLLLNLRKWYPLRKEFDQETDKCEGGTIKKPFECANPKKNELIEIYALKNKYEKSILPANVIYPFDDILTTNLNDVFVEPLISNYSSFADETDEERVFLKVDDVLKITDNIIIFGRKEYGKTTLLNYIQNEILANDILFEGKIPVFIPFSDLPKNNYHSIVRIIAKTLGHEINAEKIESYLKNGNIIFLIDDYDDYGDDSREKRKSVLSQISKSYSKCRYILTMNEKISDVFKQDTITLFNHLNIKSYYLYSFNTAKIRQLLEKWRNYQTFDINKILKQIVFYFHQLQIPVTPMAITLFMGVLIRDKAHKNMNNEAYLIENYLESILEKLSPSQVRTPMDFRDKESFLSHIAYQMYLKGKTNFSREAFEAEKLKYYEEYDEELPPQNIFNDFFKKGIFTEIDGKISFKFRFWYNFFLAKAMQKDIKKRDTILNSKRYLKFSSAIAYKAGLDRNDIELLSIIDERAQAKIKEFLLKHDNKILDDFPIETELIKYSDNIETEIKEKNNHHFKDKYKDDKYLTYEKKDQEIWTDEESESDDNGDNYDDIVELITLTSDIIRNTTEMVSQSKQQFIKNNVNSYLALMWQSVEVFKDIIHTMDKEELKEFLFFKSGNDSPELVELIDRARDMVIQIIPLSTIFYMAEHLLNPKLKRSLTNIIRDEPNLSKKLIYILLLLDLDTKESILEARKILQSSKSRILDHLMFLYLLIFSKQEELSTETFDEILRLLQEIRKKHAEKIDHPTFVTDKFESNIKKKRLMIKHH